jgi:hypothetical protein
MRIEGAIGVRDKSRRLSTKALSPVVGHGGRMRTMRVRRCVASLYRLVVGRSRGRGRSVLVGESVLVVWEVWEMVVGKLLMKSMWEGHPKAWQMVRRRLVNQPRQGSLESRACRGRASSRQHTVMGLGSGVVLSKGLIHHLLGILLLLMKERLSNINLPSSRTIGGPINRIRLAARRWLCSPAPTRHSWKIRIRRRSLWIHCSKQKGRSLLLLRK